MKTDNKKDLFININGFVFLVEFFTYRTGNKGFKLINKETGDQVANCTINLDGSKLLENEVIIKDYHENTGMYKALLKANFIHHYRGRLSVGHNTGLICKLNMNYEYKNESS